MLGTIITLIELVIAVFLFFLVLNTIISTFDSYQKAMESLYGKIDSFSKSTKELPVVQDFDKENFLPIKG